MVSAASDAACQLHNVQFYNLLPRAIVCSSFGQETKKLALARDDGTIEIWNMANAPFLEKTIPGGEGISIEGLAWAGKRLFSVSLAGTLIEWDLGKVPYAKQSILVTGNAAWCIDVSKDERLLAVGTEGGYINVYRLDNDEITYERILDKQQGRIVCCSFDHSGDFLVTGSADAVRIWDVRNGHAVHKMAIGRASSKQETTVWAVLVLKDFIIVSADSRGKLVVYDGQLGTVLEQHVVSTADLLCLAHQEDYNQIFVGGVESTIRVYERMDKKGYKGDKILVRAYQRRGHTHDIKTMSIYGRNLFSGGLDGSLLVTSSPPFKLDTYFPLLPSPASVVATECRLMLLKYVDYLEVWTLAPPNKPSQGGDKVLQIRSKKDEHILCAAISPNGRWIFYSTEHTVRLFRFDYNSQEPTNSQLLRVRNTPEHLAVCYRVDFTHDSKGLLLYDRTGDAGTIQYFSCTADENEEWDHKQSIDAGRWLSETVHLSTVSNCNSYLVCADLSSSIVVFERTAKSAKWKRSISLPRYQVPPTAIAIQPGKTRLAVAFPDHKLFVYDFDELKFVFSTYIKPPASAYPVSAIVFDPRHESAMVLQNGSNIVSLRFGPDIENELQQQEAHNHQSKKQRPMSNGSSHADGEESLRMYKLRLVRDASRLVSIEWLGKNELVATEANALSMVEHLPAAFRMKKYGKT
ncbi:U3 small nucleolar RNA-associated protein 4 homolog [Anopheles funestus]|uniref:U3 small nucleolar RNA-associated protein 4 homolog n=1 Tax=Anopheles funestus TaxID=62324 RepID=UPI0020C6EACE|nr:U3 small nucleolar RNA-associated protein 4 homolog [Anopheles funestus]